MTVKESTYGKSTGVGTRSPRSRSGSGCWSCSALRSGRTTLLRGLAKAVDAAVGPELPVLLIDEPPEARPPGVRRCRRPRSPRPPPTWRPPSRCGSPSWHWSARAGAQSGADVVLIVDSLSRFAVASGKAAEVKRLFGSGRDLAEEGAGSLTVVASLVADAEDDGITERAVSPRQRADPARPELAAAGVFPALVPGDCRVSNEGSFAGPGAGGGTAPALAARRPCPGRSRAPGPRAIEGSRTNAELSGESLSAQRR